MGRHHTRTFALKIDFDGNYKWVRFYGSTEMIDDKIFSVEESPEGGYILAGTSWYRNNNAAEYFLLRLDENCDSLWSRTYGSPGVDECRQVIITSDGDYAMVGTTSAVINSPSSHLVIIANADGDSLWGFARIKYQNYHHAATSITELDRGYFGYGRNIYSSRSIINQCALYLTFGN